MVMSVAETATVAAAVITEMERAVVGKRGVLEHVMAACLCSGGHVLFEDYPGLAKTLIARSFATARFIRFSPEPNTRYPRGGSA